MNKIKRSWDFLPEEKRQKVVKEITYYFKNERDEEIGLIAAENILDFFLQAVGGAIYNTALEDVKKFLEEKFGSIVIDLDVSFRKQDKLK